MRYNLQADNYHCLSFYFCFSKFLFSFNIGCPIATFFGFLALKYREYDGMKSSDVFSFLDVIFEVFVFFNGDYFTATKIFGFICFFFVSSKFWQQQICCQTC